MSAEKSHKVSEYFCTRLINFLQLRLIESIVLCAVSTAGQIESYFTPFVYISIGTLQVRRESTRHRANWTTHLISVIVKLTPSMQYDCIILCPNLGFPQPLPSAVEGQLHVLHFATLVMGKAIML